MYWWADRSRNGPEFSQAEIHKDKPRFWPLFHESFFHCAYSPGVRKIRGVQYHFKKKELTHRAWEGWTKMCSCTMCMKE